MAQQNLGRIAMIYRGDYLATRDYEALDIVYSAGSTYLCIASCKGTAPPRADKWQLMAPSPALHDKQAAELAAEQAASSATQAGGSATAAATSATQAASSAAQAQASAQSAVPPVGIILSFATGVSPATIWAGTVWAMMEAGRTLISAGTGYSLGSAGGSASHNHGLEAGHAEVYSSGSASINWASRDVPSYPLTHGLAGNVVSVAGATGNKAVPLGGATDSGSSLPPYKAVNMWTRTA